MDYNRLPSLSGAISEIDSVDAEHHEQQHGSFEHEYENIPVTVEEPWTEEWESLLHSWREEAETNGNTHQEAGYVARRKYKIVLLIVLVSSSLTFILNAIFPCHTGNENKTFAYYFIIIIAGINVFINAVVSHFNYQEIARIHFDFDLQHKNFVREIDYELARDRDFRLPADAFMTLVKERGKMLNMAPPPARGLCGFW